MKKLYPDFYFDSIHKITPGFLKAEGVRLLILDVDNTIAVHDKPIGSAEKGWVYSILKEGIKIHILSNNSEKRVRPVAEMLGVSAIPRALKPFSLLLSKVRRKEGVKKEETAIVGDQLFTDVLCGKYAGVKTILVKPFSETETRLIGFKRKLEKIALKNFKK